MASYTGYVDNTGAYANQNMLALIHDKLVLEGWTILRYNTGIAVRELIAKGVGYSGTEEIFIGFRSYESVPSDHYNISVACFTGYVSGNSFDTQPGYSESGVCGHGIRIDYWLNISPQRVAFMLKVGTPVYEFGYTGKYFPYATPSQYPYPVVCFGMLSGIAATRYSDTSHGMPYKGSRANALLRDVAGSWIQPPTWPFNASGLCSPTGSTSTHNGQERDTNGTYSLNPVIVMKTGTDVYGELEGVYHISGFSNGVENTLSISGDSFVVGQDVWRTDFNDYIAMKVT